MEDVKTLRPTIFPSVPRLLNRVYSTVLGNVEEASAKKKKFFTKAMASKKKRMEDGTCCGGPTNKHWLWDRLVFKKTRQALGGRVRLIVTGSAPISDDVMRFLRSAFACTVLEGYGASETAAATTITKPGDMTLGHVGLPLPCSEIALQSIPEMSYFVDDATAKKFLGKSGGKKAAYKLGGEICVRGPHVMRGYINNKEKTLEAIDTDGWYHTGDVGVWIEGGRLKIVDRKKSLLKLAQGEYVAPEKVEGLLLAGSRFISQIWVHGDSLKSFVVAIVVPDVRACEREWGQQWGEAFDLENQRVRDTICKAILADFVRIGKSKGPDGRDRLRGFEIPRAVRLHLREFQEDDLLTPTSKAKRNVMVEFFADEIEAMYDVTDE